MYNDKDFIIDDFELQITQLEHSMGRSTDGSSEWKIFPNPTKNEMNEGNENPNETSNKPQEGHQNAVNST